MFKEFLACAIWLVIAYFLIEYIHITGWYRYIWLGIVFSSGIFLALLVYGIHQALHGKSKTRYIIAGSLLAIALIGGISYLIWPFNYDLNIENSKGKPLYSNISITSNGELFYYREGSDLNITLWKGNYNVSINSQGYHSQNLTINNTIAFRKNRDNIESVVLSPRFINLSRFSFLDPTHTIILRPRVHANGTDILEERVNTSFDYGSMIMYGNYSLGIVDDDFVGEAGFAGDALTKNGTSVDAVVLAPNARYIRITDKESEYIFNFLADYLVLSDRNRLDGFPKQAYLYSKDIHISLGKLLFLTCEKEAYTESGVTERTYFVPKTMRYGVSGDAVSFTECYRQALMGDLPAMLNGSRLEDEIHRAFTGYSYPIYQFGELNAESRGPEVAFTFDIESGRYVQINSSPYTSPCEENYSIGLSAQEMVCNEPSYVAWMSPRADQVTYSGYPYPAISGILGFFDILSYSQRYGIPTTDFATKKDILSFKVLEPSLVEQARALLSEGLIEVGSHTRYHTDLGLVDADIAEREIRESKLFLEEFFNTTVFGLRPPYLSLPVDMHAFSEWLRSANYTYYSNYGDRFEIVDGLINKPFNTGRYGANLTTSDVKALLKEKPFVVFLDHPWNLIYNDKTVLSESPDNEENYRANVLTVISEGGIPVMLKDLK
jgi:peptidoglycan/xylan/chitin deacetylase (PgdA/CDA1 family)